MRLLISVTDAAEAVDAAGAGADIIDVKDPGAGSLGRAPAEWVRAIRSVQSLDVLIRPPQHRRRDRQAEGLGGLEVDDEP